MASIIVSGVPDICERKHLVAHFSNNLDHVLFPLGKDSTRALVVFKTQRAAEDALKQPVVIFGQTLKTRPAPRQTYQQCTAHVDGLIVASIPDLQSCIRELQTEFGVDVNFSHDSGSMVLSGSLMQIQCAQTKLDGIFREQQEVQARELLMVEQDLTTPRQNRSMAFTPQGEEQTGTRLGNTWTGSHSTGEVAPTHSQYQPRYRQGSDSPQVDAMFSGTGRRTKTGGSQTLTTSRSGSLRQSGGSTQDSSSLLKQSGRGHLNTGQAYRREQSLSQEDGFTVRGVKIQRHTSKDQSPLSSLDQDRPVSETDQHKEPVMNQPPLRHTYAWGNTNTKPQAPARAPSPKQLVLPPQRVPEKLNKNGIEFLCVKLELDQDLMGYIKKIHKAEVKDLERSHAVQFSNRWVNGIMEVRITAPLSDTEEAVQDKLSAARQDFVSFYQSVFYSVVKDTVSYQPSRVPESEVEAVTTAVGKAFASRVYVNSSSPGEIVLVGSWDYLPLVKEWVNKKLAEVKVTYKGHTSKSKSSSTGRHDKHQKAGVGISQADRGDKASRHMNGHATAMASPPVFTHTTPEGLEVLIYKADITQVETQAIVNASNDSLHHVGTIALAISEAAGPELQRECTEYIDKNGPMRVSEVMSTPGGGRLYCGHVIHSVGPMWCLYTDKGRCGDALRQTFLNTLYYANNKLKVKSLATPAISSGVYGVPLDVCTQALFSAIQAFSPAATYLKQVHVVDLEADAAGMMSIIFQQLAEGAGLTGDDRQLRVEDIEDQPGDVEPASDSRGSAALDLDPTRGQVPSSGRDLTRASEAVIQPSTGEIQLMSAPPRLQVQESSDWPESPPPSPRQHLQQRQDVYSGSDSDYEEPITEDIIHPTQVADVQHALTLPDSFEDLESTLESERSRHSQQPSREASFHSLTGGQQTENTLRQQDYTSPRQQEYQSPRQQEYQSPGQQGFTSPKQQGYISPKQQDYQSPRQQEFRSPRQQDQESTKEKLIASPGLQSPRFQSPRQEAIDSIQQQDVSGLMSEPPGHRTPVTRSGQATPRSAAGMSQTSRSGVVSPRSGQITPRSGQITPRSGQITPRSDRIAPKSDPMRQRSGEVTPRSSQATPRSGHFTPRSGDITPRSGQATPRRSGQTTPKASHLLQDVDLESPRSSAGMLTPRSQGGRDSARSGPLSPRDDDTAVKTHQMVSEMFSQPPASSPEQPIVPHSTPALESTPVSESQSRQSSAMQESLPDNETQLLKQAHQLQESQALQMVSENLDYQQPPARPKTPESTTLSEMFDQGTEDRVPLLIKLVASAICVAEKGGEIIRNILKAGDLGIVEKTGINDLQTEADRSANTSITTSLRRQFPAVKVIGEEDEEGESEIPAEWLASGQCEEVLQYMREVPDHLRDIQPKDVVIWVDPLDGTSEFTQGLLDHVTVLIGVSVKGQSVGGVIHQPYYNYQQGAHATLGRTIWGIIGVGAFGFNLVPPPTGSNIVCTTRSHSNRHVNAAVDSCQPTEILRVGGSGHKVLLLLEGAANAYVFASPGTKKWDTCGPEAVLHAVGGKLTDMHGNFYSYGEAVNKKNTGGVLATVGREEHGVYLSLIPQEVKDELPTDGPATWQVAQQITDRLQGIQVPLVLRLLAAAVSVSEKAGEIVRDVMKQGELGIVEKGVNDLQTQADRSAQECIIGSLRKQFPEVSIIGEEGEESSEVRADWLYSDQSEEVLELSGHVPEELRDVIGGDVTVWVDPLDGTAEYTQGLLDHVTVLIGISVEGRAVAGVIYQPFYNYQSGPDARLGRTIWGMIGVGSFGFTQHSPPDGQNIVCTTRSHSNRHVNAAVDSCEPTEVLRVGGSGHKVLLLLEGLAHAYVFASPGTKKWDTCAPEAVLHAAGGRLTDIHGNQYQYGTGVEKKNKGGVLATASSGVHVRYIQAIPTEVRDELPSDGRAPWQQQEE